MPSAAHNFPPFTFIFSAGSVCLLPQVDCVPAATESAVAPVRLGGKSFIATIRLAGSWNGFDRPWVRRFARRRDGRRVVIVATEEERLLRLPEVLRLCGLSRSAVYDLIANRDFPPAVRIGARTVAWRHSEVQQWIATRPRATGFLGRYREEKSQE